MTETNEPLIIDVVQLDILGNTLSCFSVSAGDVLLIQPPYRVSMEDMLNIGATLEKVGVRGVVVPSNWVLHVGREVAQATIVKDLWTLVEELS